MRDLVKEAETAIGGHKFSLHFLLTEWEQVVDAWQLDSWDAYRDVAVSIETRSDHGKAMRTAMGLDEDCGPWDAACQHCPPPLSRW